MPIHFCWVDRGFFQVRAVHDWQKGTLKISDRTLKVKLKVHAIPYVSDDHSVTYSEANGLQSDATSYTEESSSMKVNVSKCSAGTRDAQPSSSWAKEGNKMVTNILWSKPKKSEKVPVTTRKYTWETYADDSLPVKEVQPTASEILFWFPSLSKKSTSTA